MSKKVALIFPGQGAQKVGMGKEFYDASPAAKNIFDTADKICGNNLSKVIFEGPQELLTSTAYCQPAILTMSVAALEAFKSHSKFKEIDVVFTAGLSLGEYSALSAANCLSFEDNLKLVMNRANFMEEATKENKGAMAAIIGFDVEKLKVICKDTGAQMANFNSREQIVITGHEAKVHTACEAIKVAGGQKVIPLVVSGAFHSNLMQSAAIRFATALHSVNLKITAIPVISNVNAKPHQDVEGMKVNLANQITSCVQWVDSIDYMINQGVTNFIEIGPSKVLKGLMRRINPEVSVQNIEKPADIDSLGF